MGYIGSGPTRFNTADELTVTGDANVTGTVKPAGDTASGDNAAVGYTAAEGLILAGQGSSNDVTIKNDADAPVIAIPTGTTNVTVAGTVTADDLDLSVGTAGDGIQVTSTGANYLNLGFDTNRTGASQTLTQIEQKWNGTAVARISFVTGSDTTNKDDAEIRFQTASAGTPATAMTVSSNGAVNIGGTSTAYKFYVHDNTAGQYAAIIRNEGDNSNRYGLLIQCGANAGDGTLIGFNDGDGTGIGAITFSGGTVTYAAFTANHLCIIPDADNDPNSNLPAYPYGTLLETTSLSYTKNRDDSDTERGIIYNVRKTQATNSKAVLGAYGGCLNGGPDNQTNEHQVLILGDGHILCNNSGGNIEMGDGICSSAAVGIGQKATASPSMIIGIAQEAVTFSSDTETKLVAVQYGLQQFTPWS